MKAETIARKSWPRIRLVTVKGDKFWQVDARRKGTAGERETFALGELEEAKKRANEIEEDFNSAGVEGLSMDAVLRGMALNGARILAPYGKTIAQAVDFFKTHLDTIQRQQNAATVEALAVEWLAYKTNKNNKTLRGPTIKRLAATKERLIKAFGSKTILEVLPSDADEYFANLPDSIGKRRRFDLRAKFSQFWNWCIKKKKCTTENPFGHIEIIPDNKAIRIFTPTEAEKLMRLCETKHADFTLFFALALFGGLRPDYESENQKLKWEDVSLDTRTIYIHADNSKIKEDRNVPINDTLFAWLSQYRLANAKGLVTSPKNFQKKRQAIHTEMGFRANGKNDGAESWPQDITRHSFCSYWLAKNQNRAELAEISGNSPSMIKKHYKRIVTSADTDAFWQVLPAALAGKKKNAKAKAKAIAKAMFTKAN